MNLLKLLYNLKQKPLQNLFPSPKADFIYKKKKKIYEDRKINSVNKLTIWMSEYIVLLLFKYNTSTPPNISTKRSNVFYIRLHLRSSNAWKPNVMSEMLEKYHTNENNSRYYARNM